MLKKLFARFWLGNKNLLLKMIGRPLKPRWLWFEATDYCNSHCTHCHIWQKQTHAKHLSLEELRRIFSDPLLNELEFITNSGGEAILNPNFKDMMRLEHELFPDALLNISTNAILAEKVLALTAELLAEGLNLNLGVSLDAASEKHDQIRGVPGNFKKLDYLLRGAVALREKYPKNLTITAGFTLSRLTIDEWEAAQEYASRLGIELMVQWYNQSSFYGNEADDSEALKEKMLAAVSAQPQSSVRERWLKLLNNRSIKFRCLAVDTFFVLKCDGAVAPCLSRWDLVFGNARDKSLTEIWRSPEAKAARKIVAQCPGCLNSWGLNWSLSSFFYPRLMFFVRHPQEIVRRLKEKK